MNNMEIRDMLFRHNLKHWRVAEKVGVSATTFSRWLRMELPVAKKNEIMEAINELVSSQMNRDLDCNNG